MGKELKRIGAPFRQPEWSALALIDAPDLVLEAHESLIDAGAEVITTNAFAVVPFHIGDERFDTIGGDLVEVAAEVAREAAEAERPVLVPGCLPSLFGSYQPELFDPERAPEIIDQFISRQAPFVDLWMAETLSSLEEFDAVVEGLERHVADEGDDLELWASFTVADNLLGETATEAVLRSGESIGTLVEHVAGRCSSLLFNCSNPETIDIAIGQLAEALGPKPSIAFGAYANAIADVGEILAKQGLHETRNELTPSVYARHVAGWIEQGATIVGGCCGINPDHIAALVDLQS
jgi:S-methylmethionine-dependent homocysteine/selenocysteine methylase